MIRTAKTGEQDTVIATLAIAFAADPTVRWFYPDTERYTRYFNALARVFGGKAFEQGMAHLVDGCIGAALWLPPGVQPDEEELGGLMQRSTEPDLQDNLFTMMEQMFEFHPQEPHWHLTLIGVDQIHQGKGYGSALLTHALTRCDHDGTPAYLESTNPANQPLYERHGFEPLGEIQAGLSPVMVPMVRWPRQRMA